MSTIATAEGVHEACQLRNDVIYDAYVKYNEVSPWITFLPLFGHTPESAHASGLHIV